jgi:hypothetical protein
MLLVCASTISRRSLPDPAEPGRSVSGPVGLLYGDRNQPGVSGPGGDQAGEHSGPEPGIQIINVGLDQYSAGERSSTGRISGARSSAGSLKPKHRRSSHRSARVEARAIPVGVLSSPPAAHEDLPARGELDNGWRRNTHVTMRASRSSGPDGYGTCADAVKLAVMR